MRSDFALQFVAILGLGLLLYATGTDFRATVVFGVALAGAAMIVRAPGTLLIARALSARAHSASGNNDDQATSVAGTNS